ncbi:hypothetical protein GB927_002090 [Shinella sp. CPCC 100929]|uniref:Uncharacterized protein n=1 Tax=Shinella lacus TaxID=2654216 RepID=A0ABT1R0V5_9HYPH|nr:hypothetical protein [Shinella lacus]MCQ4628807.1 hypothetical protein [Shinella lacus]
MDDADQNHDGDGKRQERKTHSERRALRSHAAVVKTMVHPHAMMEKDHPRR